MSDVPTSYSIIFSMFGCINSNLFNGNNLRSNQLTKLNMKTEQTKKLFEEVLRFFK